MSVPHRRQRQRQCLEQQPRPGRLSARGFRAVGKRSGAISVRGGAFGYEIAAALGWPECGGRARTMAGRSTRRRRLRGRAWGWQRASAATMNGDMISSRRAGGSSPSHRVSCRAAGPGSTHRGVISRACRVSRGSRAHVGAPPRRTISTRSVDARACAPATALMAV
eukprot:scaffold5296_cov105-Isochrysis_galbana.AAC.1